MALLRIQKDQDSIGISLTLEILKHGKQLDIAISFDTDTGELFSGLIV